MLNNYTIGFSKIVLRQILNLKVFIQLLLSVFKSLMLQIRVSFIILIFDNVDIFKQGGSEMCVRPRSITFLT